jgi:putative zinc finger/helix-turn-helix YgiT family protein
MKTCANCNERVTFEPATDEHVFTVGKKKVAVPLRALKCPSCGETYVNAAEMQRGELVLAEVLAQSGVTTGDAFKFARKALGLKATELGDLLGASSFTISRWETGERDVDRAAWAVVAAMVRDALAGRDDTKNSLLAAQKPKPVPSRVA